MKKITKRRGLILLSIVSNFCELPDFAMGSFIGIGIGLLLTSLIFVNLKSVRN